MRHGRLLDDPARGPGRADLLLQWEVARKHATVQRRDPPVLPPSLARGFAEVLRPHWEREGAAGV